MECDHDQPRESGSLAWARCVSLAIPRVSVLFCMAVRFPSRYLKFSSSLDTLEFNGIRDSDQIFPSRSGNLG